MNEQTVMKIVLGANIPKSPWVQRCDRLKAQHQEAEYKKHGVEDQKSGRVLLPVLRSAIQPALEPSEESGRVILYRP